MMLLTLNGLACPPGFDPRKIEVTEEQARVGVLIGRSPDTVDVYLPDPSQLLSRRHCTVSFADGQFRVTDHSTNGVLVERAGRTFQLTPSISEPLLRDDQVRLGLYIFEVIVESKAQARPAEPYCAPIDDGRLPDIDFSALILPVSAPSPPPAPDPSPAPVSESGFAAEPPQAAPPKPAIPSPLPVPLIPDLSPLLGALGIDAGHALAAIAVSDPTRTLRAVGRALVVSAQLVEVIYQNRTEWRRFLNQSESEVARNPFQTGSHDAVLAALIGAPEADGFNAEKGLRKAAADQSIMFADQLKALNALADYLLESFAPESILSASKPEGGLFSKDALKGKEALAWAEFTRRWEAISAMQEQNTNKLIRKAMAD